MRCCAPAWPRDTPARGDLPCLHLPQQRQAVCTLATVADTLADADLVSPAVLVVGDVVQAAPLWQQRWPEAAARAASSLPGG